MKRSSVAAPDSLQRARAALDQIKHIHDVGAWHYYHPNSWAVDFSVTLDQKGTEFMPQSTRWYAVVSGLYPEGPIDVFPAKEGGIENTFWHQNFNGDGTGKEWGEYEWRSGKLCLDHPFDMQRLGKREPLDALVRLSWHGERTVQWCKQAIDETLVQSGQPFELPQHPSSTDIKQTLAFCEDGESFREWQDTECREGLVELRHIRTSPNIHVTSDFMDARRISVKRIEWGNGFQKLLSKEASIGLWVRLDRIPVDKPWAFPHRWADLYSQCLISTINLKDLLDKHAKSLRDGKPHIVLVGFPIPEKFGEEPERLHWASLVLPPLTDKKTSNRNKFVRKEPAKGFRKNETGFLQADNLRIRHPSIPVPWCKSYNWAADQLRTRGALPTEVANHRIMVIGAGALGSLFSEYWVRAGGQISKVLDFDILGAGNLSRHTLSLEDIGGNKSESVAHRLSLLNPHLSCSAVRKNLLSHTAEEFRALLSEVDAVVDCTGSDEVLAYLKANRADSEKHYVSLSTGFHARHLYVFSSREISFPLAKFREVYAVWERHERGEVDREGLPWEGIGCWHPLMPARIDSLGILAGLAMKFVERCVIDKPEKKFEVLPDDGAIASSVAKVV